MMNELEDNNSQEAEELEAEVLWPSPGEKLKEIREELGLSHARVADALHMTVRYVKALEENEYDKLPGKTFIKGYFKAYARLLEVDVEEVEKCYMIYSAAIEESEQSEANVIKARKAYDQNMRWIICAAVIIVVVIALSWWLAQDDPDSAVSDVGSRQEQPTQTISEDVSRLTAEQLVASLNEAQRENEDVDVFPSSTLAVNDVSEQEEDVFSEGSFAEEQQTDEVTFEETPDEEIRNEEVASNIANEVGEEENVFLQELAEEAEESLIELSAEESLTGGRLVSLQSAGEDILQLRFSGSSWVEIENRENIRLYNDMLNSGDELNLTGEAPFNILIGDATKVAVIFNSAEINIAGLIRSDSSARVVLQAEAESPDLIDGNAGEQQ